MIMASSNKNTHLTYEERCIIETGIRNGSSKAAIAKILGKDKSTIGKEIALHRTCCYKRKFYKIYMIFPLKRQLNIIKSLIFERVSSTII